MKKQVGFLTGHSTVYQLIDLYHQIAQSFDNKTHTCVIFCDISDAFDRVWYKDRYQRVFIGQSYSSFKPVTAGVPQGLVLDPLLFLMYVNNIADNLLSIARLFADDTSLASTISNVDDLQGILNHDLREISNWSTL